MKTKLTFLSIAIALVGVGMLMAFKQESGKKYAFVRAVNFPFKGPASNVVIYKDGLSKEYVIDYSANDTEAERLKKRWDIIISNVISENYELKQTSVWGNFGDYTEYIFEKE